jgi:hypothetical protein
MNIEQLIKRAAAAMLSGARFNLRSIDADDRPTGPVIPCVVVEQLKAKDGWPVILAHVGQTQDVTMLHLTSDEIEGATVITVIGVCGSDAKMDHDYSAEMLSDEWAGALLVVLD